MNGYSGVSLAKKSRRDKVKNLFGKQGYHGRVVAKQ